MKNIEKIRQLTPEKLAYKLCVDDNGVLRSPCSICAHFNDCDDECYKGVLEWLEKEE